MFSEIGPQPDYSPHSYLSNYPHSHHASAFRSHAVSNPYAGGAPAYVMKNDVMETFSYDQAFCSDLYPYGTYTGQSSYPTSSVGLTSAGNSGSAFNLVQSGMTSFGGHQSYQPNGMYFFRLH